ncbi:phage portal protein [Orenia metallireducens]|uniref:Phage portal protein n=1 Tax=Orenia metallireducens TaxID=1413210 RepID=A0A1C0ADB5_9FIRM|nr:phage portal protein [Orenia metallireducens]OCL28654.1 phage portal protein [Orenia metallireducens]
MFKWTKKVVGEISKLRNYFPGILTGLISRPYKVDSSEVDYQLARELYNNTNDKYKLGAAFCKPIINTPVGFMGVPWFRAEDESAQTELKDFFNNNASKMQRVHRNALRDGKCYVWITREEVNDILYPEKKVEIKFNIIPPEQVTNVKRHPLTGKVTEYTLESVHEWKSARNAKKRCTVTQIISADKIITEIDGDKPEEIEAGEETNKWGFIPIVTFYNEKDEYMLNGKSDLEAIEPFIKAYHDVMEHAIKGSKMHSTPRLKLKVADVAAFLKNNFGIDDPAKFAREGGAVDLDGHELLFLQAGNDKREAEDAEFIEVQSAIGSAEVLLKFLFYCIISVSETPEFAFGTHIKSSNASVKEQMPILIRRVSRKREQFEDSWQLVARIVLAMLSISSGKKYSTHQTTILWDEIDPRDTKDIATEIKTIVEALVMAYNNDLLSHEAAVSFLSNYIDTMSDYITDDPEIPGERDKIINSRLLSDRLGDADLADEEQKLIDEVLSQVEGNNDE